MGIRVSPFSGSCQQFVDLLAVQQEFAPAHWIVVLAVAVGVRADVRVDQPSLVSTTSA